MVEPSKIYQIDKDTDNIVAVFDSLGEAARALIGQESTKDQRKHVVGRIARVCDGERVTYAGFKWSMNGLYRSCPFCHSKLLTLEKDCAGVYYAKCHSCFARGPLAPSEDIAARAWNHRK